MLHVVHSLVYRPQIPWKVSDIYTVSHGAAFCSWMSQLACRYVKSYTNRHLPIDCLCDEARLLLQTFSAVYFNHGIFFLKIELNKNMQNAVLDKISYF